MASWHYLCCKQIAGNPWCSHFHNCPNLWRDWATDWVKDSDGAQVASSLCQYLNFLFYLGASWQILLEAENLLRKVFLQGISLLLCCRQYCIGWEVWAWRFRLDLVLIWFRSPALMIVGSRYIREKEQGDIFWWSDPMLSIIPSHESEEETYFLKI